MFTAASSGRMLLKVVSVFMILLGVVGLVSAVSVFGQVEGELAKIDATVQEVAQTVTYAADGVEAASGALTGGIDSVNAFLTNTGRGLTETSVVVSGAKVSIANAANQVPVVIGSTANTVESAAFSLLTARQELTQATNELNSLRSSLDLTATVGELNSLRSTLDLTTLGEETRAQKAQLDQPMVTLGGADLVAAAPLLAPYLGLPESYLVQLGQDLTADGRMFTFALGSLQLTGADLIALADAAETMTIMDASLLRAEGEAVGPDGTLWSVPLTDNLDQIADGAVQLDRVLAATGTTLSATSAELQGVLGAAGSTLNATGAELQNLSANLNENARTFRATVPDITGVTNQAQDFLTVASKELAAVDSSLKGMATEVGTLGNVATEQLVQVNSGLRGTAEAMSGISITAIGNDLVGGLRTYMMLTSALFILAGVGLFAASLRPEQMIPTSRAA
jgi:hypothetical protein